MKKFLALGMAALMVAIAGMMLACGVPREAATLALGAAAATMPAADANVRAQLAAQDAAWARLAQLLQQREFGGITGVDATFTALVNQTAALAKRQHELIDANQDNAAANRAALQAFQGLWQSAGKYLNP